VNILVYGEDVEKIYDTYIMYCVTYVYYVWNIVFDILYSTVNYSQ